MTQVATDPTAPPLLDREEVRFAVVLNGGVSLAVWMGGVVHEIDAVTQGYADDERPPKHAYGRLMTALGVRARADVITGTSAGGINGAALALAQINQNADLATLRDLWAQQGRMETLLQRPFTGKPRSLLRGEEYFLPKLGEAMSRLSQHWTPRVGRPVDLTITTTLLSGALSTTTDSLGQVLPQLRHDGRFRFRRGFKEIRQETVDGRPRYVEYDHDDFTGKPEMAARLGLSARCSAGFPVAFEPSFVPVGHPEQTPADPIRPDMCEVANWADFNRHSPGTGATPASRDVSRFAVDGGVLSNTPTREAMDAIQQLAATEPVQRVMLLVFPHAPSTLADEPSDADWPPALPGSLGSMLSALRADGGRTHVDKVEEHNRRAACRRDTRADLLRGSELSTLAGQLYDSYARLRIQRAARDLPHRIDLPASWSFERARQACLKAQEDYRATHGTLPYVPEAISVLPGSVQVSDTAADAATEVAPTRLRTWGWGATTALDIADTALAVVQALRQQGRTPQLAEAAKRIHEQMSAIRIARAELDESWRTMPFEAPDEPAPTASERFLLVGPDVAYWVRRLEVYDFFMNGRDVDAAELPTPLVGRRAAGGHVTAEAVSEIIRQLLSAWTSHPGAGSLDGWGWLFESDRSEENQGTADEGERERELLERLLKLHVVSWTLGDEIDSDNTRPVELVQLSAQVKHPFATYCTDMASKLGSDELGRFSGFLKTSWRMNDWTWGRLDAAVMLIQILLRPSRLHRYATALQATKSDAVAPKDVVGSLFEVVAGVPLTPDLDLEVLREQAEAEVAQLLTIKDDDSVRSPALAQLLAYGRQVETIVTDLPAIASGVLADVADGSGERSAGSTFLHEAATTLRDIERLPVLSKLEGPELAAARALHFKAGSRSLLELDRSGIGREGFSDVANTDQVIRTAMTAAAVVGTFADGPASGLSKLKPVTKFVRGALLLPYWVTLGLTSASAVARLLAVLVLSFGAATLALAVLGVLPSAVAAAAAMVGAGTVLFVFTYAAARTGSVLHAFAFMTAGLPLLAVGIDRLMDRADDSSSTAFAVLLVIVGVGCLGSVPNPIVSPAALVKGTIGRLLTVLAVIVVAVVIVLIRGWIADQAESAFHQVVPKDVDTSAEFWDWLLPAKVQSAAPWLGVGLLVVAVLVAWVLDYTMSRGLAPVAWTTQGGVWKRGTIRHPAALFAAWSPVYGGVYAAVACCLWAAGWVSTGWGVTGLVVGALFTFVAPFWAVGAARRAITDQLDAGISLVHALAATQAPPLGGEGAFSEWLALRGLLYSFLVGQTDASGGGDPKSPPLAHGGKTQLGRLRSRYPAKPAA